MTKTLLLEGIGLNLSMNRGTSRRLKDTAEIDFTPIYKGLKFGRKPEEKSKQLTGNAREDYIRNSLNLSEQEANRYIRMIRGIENSCRKEDEKDEARTLKAYQRTVKGPNFLSRLASRVYNTVLKGRI